MTSDVIPEDARQFLLKHIESVAQWEGLLLIRSDPKAKWSAERVAKSLYLNDAEAARLLADLAAQGFLATSGSRSTIQYAYKPKSPQLDQMTAQVAELYKRYLIPITHIIHSKPKTRIQEFADAFRIRKD